MHSFHDRYILCNYPRNVNCLFITTNIINVRCDERCASHGRYDKCVCQPLPDGCCVVPRYLQANKELKGTTDFRLALRHAQHAAIFETFRTFNRKGGALVTLQTGETIYFARACILAIYADHPAARKCTLTGSSCPVCYTPAKKMSLPEQEPRYAQKRNHTNMTRKKAIFNTMANSGMPAARVNATKKAKFIGVNMTTVNAWTDHDAPLEEKVFGPCELRDNIWGCMPQVTLHGMDEGLTEKANAGALEAIILEAKARFGFVPTKVRAVKRSKMRQTRQ